MSGFVIPELIIESVIRDGLKNVQTTPAIIDNVFAHLTRSYNRKYGAGELTKIKAMVQKEVAVIYSYHEVDSHPYCFSIMIGADGEDSKRAHLGDEYGEIEEGIVDAAELAALEKVTGMVIQSYDPITGFVSVADSVDLSNTYAGLIFVDGSNRQFDLTGGIDNTPGSKGFFIQKGVEDINTTSNGKIKSSINTKRHELKGVTDDVNLVIGVHAKDALTTKYLYVLLKYFIISRKKDIIKRGIYNISFSGSDFNKDQQFLGDQIYTRFLTVMGKADDIWRADQITLIDHVEVEGTPIE